MENQFNFIFVFIGFVITIPFIFLCYKFHQLNQYKNINSILKMLSWFLVMVLYWFIYLNR